MGAGLGKTQIPYGGIIHVHRQKRKYPPLLLSEL